jgi:hypothetical protein
VLSARETVMIDTPASFATSWIVAPADFFRAGALVAVARAFIPR